VTICCAINASSAGASVIVPLSFPVGDLNQKCSARRHRLPKDRKVAPDYARCRD
jgi:hypothetical protein